MVSNDDTRKMSSIFYDCRSLKHYFTYTLLPLGRGDFAHRRLRKLPVKLAKIFGSIL